MWAALIIGIYFAWGDEFMVDLSFFGRLLCDDSCGAYGMAKIDE